MALAAGVEVSLPMEWPVPIRAPLLSATYPPLPVATSLPVTAFPAPAGATPYLYRRSVSMLVGDWEIPVNIKAEK